jgi:hypothetical protein
MYLCLTSTVDHPFLPTSLKERDGVGRDSEETSIQECHILRATDILPPWKRGRGIRRGRHKYPGVSYTEYSPSLEERVEGLGGEESSILQSHIVMATNTLPP